MILHLQLRHLLLCKLPLGQLILLTLTSALGISLLLGGFLAMFLVLEPVITSSGLETVAGLAGPDITLRAVEKDVPPDTTVGRTCGYLTMDRYICERFLDSQIDADLQ